MSVALSPFDGRFTQTPHRTGLTPLNVSGSPYHVMTHNEFFLMRAKISDVGVNKVSPSFHLHFLALHELRPFAM